jgi:hypothetical protein
MMLENAGMKFRGRSYDLDQDDLLDNPEAGFGGLMLENQVFTISALRAWGTAAAGVGLGLGVADFLDRYVATRKPKDGRNPWYGANAAAAYNRRPDAWRLGAQAAGGLGAMALAYATRGRGVIPWLLGGTAIGFGANLTQMLFNYWLMPLIFRVKKETPSEPNLGNRLYPLEQDFVQDTVDNIFKNFALATNLQANQAADVGQPGFAVPPVAPVDPTGPVYTLGRAAHDYYLGAPQYSPYGNGGYGHPGYAAGYPGYAGKGGAQAGVSSGQAGQPVHVKTGRLGMCSACGGYDGCWSHCPDLTICGDCPTWPPTARMCTYVVQAGDDLATLAARYNIDVAQVDAMNPPGDRAQYWIPGATVTLPYAFCMAMQQVGPAPVGPGILVPPGIGPVVPGPLPGGITSLTPGGAAVVTPGGAAALTALTSGLSGNSHPPPVTESRNWLAMVPDE